MTPHKIFLSVLALGVSGLSFPALAQTAMDKPDTPPPPAADPLNAPLVNDSDVALWSATVLPQVLSFGPANYQDVLKSAKAQFTTGGYNDFSVMLQKSKFLDGVVHSKQTLTTKTAGLPRICRQHSDGGVYHWALEVPVLFSYKAETGEESALPYAVSLRIERSNDPQNTQKIAIAGWKNVPMKDDYKPCSFTQQKEIDDMLSTLPSDTKYAMEAILKLEDENKALKNQVQALQSGAR